MDFFRSTSPTTPAVAALLEMWGSFTQEQIHSTIAMANGSAGRIRTYDQPVNSRLLYH